MKIDKENIDQEEYFDQCEEEVTEIDQSHINFELDISKLIELLESNKRSYILDYKVQTEYVTNENWFVVYFLIKDRYFSYKKKEKERIEEFVKSNLEINRKFSKISEVFVSFRIVSLSQFQKIK